MCRIVVRRASARSEQAAALMAELSAELERITGSGGATGFDPDEADGARAAFLCAYEGARAVGCGALRPLAGERDTAELKRIYAREPGRGIGRAVVRALEDEARRMRYRYVALETRRVNAAAVAFYRSMGYAERANFGRYAGRADAVCMSKELGAGLRDGPG